MKLLYPPGATPLDPDEIQGLLPAHITLQHQLNDFEQANIGQAREWAYTRRRGDPLDREFIRIVHRRMFDATWRWAGEFRRSDKNLEAPWTEVPMRLHQLAGDVRAQVDGKEYLPAEIAARYHQRLVSIHPFANGNGRHARLMADVLAQRQGRSVLTWGGADIVTAGDFRRTYIDALRAADKNEIQPLLVFARS
jgi:Fic-DOC domain mobile mystery protein B